MNKSSTGFTTYPVKHAVLVGISCTLFTLVTHAQWHLIDDFDQWEASTIYTAASDIGWHAAQAIDTDEYWMLADPKDPDNTALFVEPGGYGVKNAPVFLMKELPEGGIAPGETGILFFKSIWADNRNAWSMGTADMELEMDPVTGIQTAPGAYSDFNALIRLGPSSQSIGLLDKVISHRDRDQYVSTNPEERLENYEWYSFWMEIHNTWDDTVSPPVSTGGFSLYLQGPDDAKPRLIPVGTDPPKDLAFFRRAPADAEGNPQAIKWVMFCTQAHEVSGNDGPFLLDDFYFNRLSGWGYTPWLRDPTVLYGDVDTGDLLGWINVDRDPFIYSYAIGWLYIPDLDLDASGLWAYFYK